MPTMFKLLTLLVFVLLFVACTKKELPPDAENPSIELIYPKDVPVLTQAQPLCVKMIVTENTGLSSLSWTITNINTGKLEKTVDLQPLFTRSIVVDEKVLLPELAGEFVFKLAATDVAGNTSKLTIPFSINN